MGFINPYTSMQNSGVERFLWSLKEKCKSVASSDSIQKTKNWASGGFVDTTRLGRIMW